MLNRRELIAAGALTALQAATADRMRFAMSGHQFRFMPPHPEEGIKMTARYGYDGLEPFQEDIAKYLDKPPEALKSVLDASGLALATVGSGGQYLDPARIPQTIDSNTARARYISYFGCKHLKINLSRRAENGVENLSDPDAKALAGTLNEIGKRTMDSGVRLAFHPHCWTLVERASELAKIMDLTDPRYVYIVLDTGHASLGGIDPVKCLRDYYPRVAAMHLKDCEPKYSAGNGWKGPAPSEDEHKRTNLYKRLGAGGVDFPAIFRILRERNFNGWVTLDFDAPRPGEGTVEEDMNSHKAYLVRTLGVKLRS